MISMNFNIQNACFILFSLVFFLFFPIGKTKKIGVEQRFESVHITEHNIQTYLIARKVPAIKLNQVSFCKIKYLLICWCSCFCMVPIVTNPVKNRFNGHTHAPCFCIFIIFTNQPGANIFFPGPVDSTQSLDWNLLWRFFSLISISCMILTRSRDILEFFCCFSWPQVFCTDPFLDLHLFCYMS